MPVPVNNGFESYILSAEEELEGYFLNYLQQAVIQNLKMQSVAQRLSLTAADLTEAGKESYWQQEAYLRGQIDAYTHLQQSHAESERVQNLKESIEIQSPQTSSPI